MSAILAALPAIQSAVHDAIAARIDRGEPVAGRDYPEDMPAGPDEILDPLAANFADEQMPGLRKDAKLRQDKAKKSAA